MMTVKGISHAASGEARKTIGSIYDHEGDSASEKYKQMKCADLLLPIVEDGHE